MSGQRPQRWRGDRPPRRPYPANRSRNPQVSPEVEERIRELDSEREPLSLAEEISVEASHGDQKVRLASSPSDGQEKVHRLHSLRFRRCCLRSFWQLLLRKM